MSFETLKKEELINLVREFVGEEEANTIHNKPEAIATLKQEGVTWEFYVKNKESEKVDVNELVEEKPKENVLSAASLFKDSEPVLVKMDRKNKTYEIRGYKFTEDHPFQAMTVDEYQGIVDAVDGFRLANPREVEEFYS